MTVETGVQTESEAETQEQGQGSSSDQQSNWEQARQTMAEQKQRMELLEQQNRLLQQQQALYQSNQIQQQQQPAQQPQPWEEVPDEEVLTGADFKKAMAQAAQSFEGSVNSRLESQQRELKTMAMRSQYPDYEKVVGYALKEAETNPGLAQAIATSSDPHTLAYELGKRSETYQSELAVKTKSREAERIIENSQKPGSVNGAVTGSGNLSKAEHFMSMSDREFESYVAKVKRGIL